MFSGDPRGYYIADFSRKGVRLQYKVVGTDRRASATLSLEDELVINAYGGSSDAKVKVRLHGKGWQECIRDERIAPESQAVIDFNLSKDRDYKRAHREEFIPMLRLRSEHIWVLPAAGSLKPGDRIKIRYSDPQMRFLTKCTVRTQEELYIR